MEPPAALSTLGATPSDHVDNTNMEHHHHRQQQQHKSVTYGSRAKGCRLVAALGSTSAVNCSTSMAWETRQYERETRANIIVEAQSSDLVLLHE